jgi:hypothetical protein
VGRQEVEKTFTRISLLFTLMFVEVGLLVAAEVVKGRARADNNGECLDGAQ